MVVQQFLAKNNIPIVPHAPYSPDPTPSDFWLFPALKMGLRGRHFATVEDIKETPTRSKNIFINVTSG
jgi:transposase